MTPEERRSVHNVIAKRYRDAHAEERRIYEKKYRENNREVILKKKKNYRNANKEKINQYRNVHRVEILEKNKQTVRQYRLTLLGWLNCRMSTAIRDALKGKKNRRSWFALVGYTAEDLRKHLEFLFQPGMTWENMGEWHIDHIWPLSRLYIDGTDDPTFKFAWSLKNLQPLWAKDNISKSNKIDIAV